MSLLEHPIRYITLLCVAIFAACMFGSVAHADQINLAQGYGMLADSHIKTTEPSTIHNETGIHLSDTQCRRFVAQVDLATNFTSGDDVTAAKWCFHMNEAKDADSQEHGIHQVYCDGCYGEGNLTTDTWFSANMLNATAEDTITVANTLGWYCFDIPEMTENNMGGVLTVAVYGTGESCGGDDYKVFDSKEAADTSLRHHLNITYTPATVDVSVQNPQNTTISLTGASVNISVAFTASSPNGIDTCWWTNTDGSNVSGCANSSLLLSTGFYNITVYANSTTSMLAQTNVNFTVRDVGPTITLQAPGNTTYVNTSLLYTVYDAVGVDSCWYSTDGGITNTTLAGCANLTSLPAFNFTTLNVSVNDTLGQINFTSINFTIRMILDDCKSSGNPTAINFTFLDEDGLNATRGNMYMTVYYWSEANASVISNVSFDWQNSTSFGLCIFPNETMRINATIQYEGANGTYYEGRSYYLINAPIDNTTDRVNLYLLAPEVDYISEIYVQDENSVGQPDYAVKIQRYYPATNDYFTVAMVLTDDDGHGTTRLRAYDYFYSWIVEQNGAVVQTETRTQPVPDATSNIYTKIIVLDITGLGEVFEYIGRVATSCTYTSGTTTLRCTYSDTSGLVQTVRWEVDKREVLSWTSVCDETQSATSTTFTCDLSGGGAINGTYAYKMTALMSDGEEYTFVSDVLEFEGIVAYGAMGLFMALLLFLVMAGVGSWNPSISILLGAVSLLLSFYMGILVISEAAIAGILLVAAIAMYRMR